MWEFNGWALLWSIFVILFLAAVAYGIRQKGGSQFWDEVRLLDEAKLLFLCFVLAWGFGCYAPNYLKKGDSSRFLAETGKEGVGSYKIWQLAEDPNSEKLDRLDLSGNYFGEKGLKALTHSLYLKNVTHLDLSNTRFEVPVHYIMGIRTVSPVVLFVASKNMQGLLHLDLSGSDFSDLDAKAMANSPYLKNLTHLDVSNTGVGDWGLKAIADSPYLKELVSLVKSDDAKIGEVGAKAILKIEKRAKDKEKKEWGKWKNLQYHIWTKGWF